MAGRQDYFGSIPYTEEEKHRIATLLRQNLGDEYISRREGPGGCISFLSPRPSYITQWNLLYFVCIASVSYIEGWKILDLANDIFGFNGWANSIVRMEVLIV